MADPWNRLGGDENDVVPPRPFDRRALEATLAAAVRTADPAAGPAGSDGGVNKAVASLLRAGGVGRIGNAPPGAADSFGSASTAGGLGGTASPSALGGTNTAGGTSSLDGTNTASGTSGLGGTARPSRLGLGGATSSSAGGLAAPRPAGSGLGGSSGSPAGLTSSIGRIGASGVSLGQVAFAGDNRVSVKSPTGRAVSPLTPAPTSIERPTIPLRRPTPTGPAAPVGQDRAPGQERAAGKERADGDPACTGAPLALGETGVSGEAGTTPAPVRTVVGIEPWAPGDDDLLPQGQIKKKSFLFFR